MDSKTCEMGGRGRTRSNGSLLRKSSYDNEGATTSSHKHKYRLFYLCCRIYVNMELQP